MTEVNWTIKEFDDTRGETARVVSDEALEAEIDVSLPWARHAERVKFVRQIRRDGAAQFQADYKRVWVTKARNTK